MNITALIQALVYLLAEIVAWMKQHRLIQAGEDRAALRAKETAERLKQEREEIDRTIRDAGVSAARQQLHDHWTRQ